MTTQTEALKALIHEMEYVLSCINEDKIPFDGDDFHEALRLGKEALANHIEDNLTMVAQQSNEQVEPVRIYDYVWPQRKRDKEDCSYACSYTPAQHLAKGELLAVVHPFQLKNSYLQREGEAAHPPVPIATLTQQELLTAQPDYEKAYLVWQEKTEWVQETVKPHELGMHRADVLKQRIEETAQPKEPEQEIVATDWGAVHEKLIEIWNREISADEGLDEIQDLIHTHQQNPQRSEDINLSCKSTQARLAASWGYVKAEPLTDEQIHRASTQAGMQEHYMGFHSGFIRFAKEIEKAHGIGCETTLVKE